MPGELEKLRKTDQTRISFGLLPHLPSSALNRAVYVVSLGMLNRHMKRQRARC